LVGQSVKPWDFTNRVTELSKPRFYGILKTKSRQTQLDISILAQEVVLLTSKTEAIYFETCPSLPDMPAHRVPGCVAKAMPSMTMKQWHAKLDEKWFANQTAFLANVHHSNITDTPQALQGNPALLRTTMVFAHFGLITGCDKCDACDAVAVLHIRRGVLEWTCSAVPGGGNHLRCAVGRCSILEKIKQNSWPAFLNFVVLLRLGRPLHDIYAEVFEAFGNIDSKSFRRWRILCQGNIEKTNEDQELLKIGAPKEFVVLDETLVGVHPEDGFSSVAPKGIKKFAPAVRHTNRSAQAVRARVARTLPAQTIWKKQARTAMKAMKVMKKGKRGSAADQRSNGRWLWAAVTVGKGNRVFNHANRLKKFTFRFLPKAADAASGKPRGLQEIADTMALRIHKGSKLVFDGWLSSKSAAKKLGYDFVKPINHKVEFRDRVTGFHSNDIESENNKLKHWSRVRHSRLILNELDLHEYAYYVNVGSSMKDVMAALK